MKLLNLVLAALMLFSTVAGAQAQSGTNLRNDWANVKSLSIGQSVIVKTKTGEIFRGLVNEISDNSIKLIGKKRVAVFERGDVSQIHTARKSKILGVAGGIIGGVGGLFGSAAIAAPALGLTNSEAIVYSVGPITVIAGVVGGAILGNRIGNRWRKNRLIYQFN